MIDVQRSCRYAVLAAAAVMLAACTSTGGPTTAPPTVAVAASPSPSASPLLGGGAAASNTPSNPPSSGAPSSASPAASGQALPAGVSGANTCTILKDFDFAGTIGVAVTKSAWDGHECVWYTSAAAGGATVGWQAEGSNTMVQSFSAASLAIPGTTAGRPWEPGRCPGAVRNGRASASVPGPADRRLRHDRLDHPHQRAGRHPRRGGQDRGGGPRRLTSPDGYSWAAGPTVAPKSPKPMEAGHVRRAQGHHRRRPGPGRGRPDSGCPGRAGGPALTGIGRRAGRHQVPAAAPCRRPI